MRLFISRKGTLLFFVLFSLGSSEVALGSVFEEAERFGKRVVKEAKRTPKNIEKTARKVGDELERFGKRVVKEAKRIPKNIEKLWRENEDVIVPIVIAAAVIYVGDINLASMTLQDYGLIGGGGSIGMAFSGVDATSLNGAQTNTPQEKKSSHQRKLASTDIILHIPDPNNPGDLSNNGVMVVTRELDAIGGKIGAHSFIQVVENGTVFIMGGFKNSSTGKLDIRGAEIGVGEFLPEKGNARSGGVDSYIGYEQIGLVKINPPLGTNQATWNKMIIDAGKEVQAKYNSKLDYKLFGGDDGKTSGNCHTITRMILDTAKEGTADLLNKFDPKGISSGLHCGN